VLIANGRIQPNPNQHNAFHKGAPGFITEGTGFDNTTHQLHSGDTWTVE
jgi:hypothetical protein